MTLANSVDTLAHVPLASHKNRLTVKLDILANNSALSLVVLVDGHLDLGTVDIPSAYAANKVIKLAS